VIKDYSLLEKTCYDAYQISLDGLKRSHEIIRGENTFKHVIGTLDYLKSKNRKIIISTMIHTYNINEFEEMKRLIEKYDPVEWAIDLPSVRGNLSSNSSILPELKVAAELLNYRFGGSYHIDTDDDLICGSHNAYILPNGDICKCGFYEDKPFGNLSDSLPNAWVGHNLDKISSLPLCAECNHVVDCKGGCRYRASGNFPDYLMCEYFKIQEDKK
jgi:radical SAM protein with 4Fe4S-binding SPASM domain